MMYLDLFCIAFIMVFIQDISGVVYHLETSIGKLLNLRQKPSIKVLECSLCSTWWLGLIYLLCVGHFTIVNVAIVAMIAMLTPVIQDAERLIIDICGEIIRILNKNLIE